MPLSLPPKPTYRIGVISDTHGHLPPHAAEVFQDADLILHAGDIGAPAVLEALARIAPVVAVRGNMDWGGWAETLPEIESVLLGDGEIRLVHDLLRLPPGTASDPILALVSGHTHRPQIERRKGLLYVNPGSAGAPRSGHEACVALMRVSGRAASAELVPIRG